MDQLQGRRYSDIFERADKRPQEAPGIVGEDVSTTSRSLRSQIGTFISGIGDQVSISDGKDEDKGALVNKPHTAGEAGMDVYRLVGRQIGHYVVLEAIGGGGMGVVYRAEDTRLRRTVALKFLPPAWSRDADAKARLMHEARAASSLDHTNICTVHEVGETEDGQLFIVMAYYDAETLAERITGGPLPVGEAVDFAMQIGQGLMKAHAKGIVHRDIKPSNILVTSDDIIKIVDFGLAKTANISLTRSGVTLGTTAYMSPEQVQGELIDHRTDIWSLGAVLYEMLAGVRAFPGEDVMAVLYAIVHEKPVPLKHYRPDIPTNLERIVNRAMARKVSERFQDVDALLDELQDFVIGDTLKLMPLPAKNILEPVIDEAITITQERPMPVSEVITPAVTNEKPIRVLVVDDEPDLELLIRQRFRKQIRNQEMQFIFAADGVEALERLKVTREIDVILTDINMPRMDGLTLLSHIGKLDRVFKVVIVSAYGDMENIRSAMNKGAFDFITKPINFEDLEITIRKTHREIEMLRETQVLQRKLSAIQRELEIASQIQLSSLPNSFPAFPELKEFDIYATMIPAQEVGGDFYDFFLIDQHRLGFVLGDVSGKGIGAAMFMAVTRTMLRATAMRGLSAGECITHVNRVLFPETMPRMFVTLVYGILDTRTGEVTYCVAGHYAPYLLGRDHTVLELPRTAGIGLCLTGDFEYEEAKVKLEPGESLFLFSDGVTEAVDSTHDRFSDERLLETLKQADGNAPAQTIRHVLRHITKFAGGVVQNDDITMLVLRYQGNE